MKSNIIILSILTASLAFTACQDKLDEHVYSQLTPELAFTSGENAQAATNEIYESLHSTFRTPYFYINDMDSDVGYRNGQDFETLNDEAIPVAQPAAAAANTQAFTPVRPAANRDRPQGLFTGAAEKAAAAQPAAASAAPAAQPAAGAKPANGEEDPFDSIFKIFNTSK